ncbi:MAG: 50S ribosomal protein L21 [Rikenellaceae bacterium]|jgi:large subunit ribosomal protein L21|nr:50S ribosomal protein L21 [Rikenellaceae bacterium]
MYVIAEIAGQQFKVEKGRKLYVHRLAGDEGSSLSFDKILLTDDDGQVKVGTPVVKGASVSATIVRHLKDDKVIVFKKRRRKGYRVKNGHRQCLTQILIDDIITA